jgi:hypothetical protein
MKSTTQTSEARGTTLMLISIVFFALNIFAVRTPALVYPGCTGWQAPLFRGLAGIIFVAFSCEFGQREQWKPLFKSPLIVLRGIPGDSLNLDANYMVNRQTSKISPPMASPHPTNS